MKRVTLSFFLIVVICVCVMLVSVTLYNEARYRQLLEERNETCFQFGISLSDVMQDNESVLVESCDCFFGSVREGELVTECVCDCAIPSIPYTSCASLDGCYVRDYQCRCLYGIVIDQ